LRLQGSRGAGERIRINFFDFPIIQFKCGTAYSLDLSKKDCRDVVYNVSTRFPLTQI
jgi:hypothetical protein